MTAASNILVSLRNGVVLAMLAASPMLVGFAWNAVWGKPNSISTATVTALWFAGLACAAVVAILSFLVLREGKTLAWFVSCPRCGSNVAIISFRCMRCRQRFEMPPEGRVFRNILLLGVGVLYATFVLGALLLHQV